MRATPFSERRAPLSPLRVVTAHQRKAGTAVRSVANHSVTAVPAPPPPETCSTSAAFLLRNAIHFAASPRQPENTFTAISSGADAICFIIVVTSGAARDGVHRRAGLWPTARPTLRRTDSPIKASISFAAHNAAAGRLRTCLTGDHREAASLLARSGRFCTAAFRPEY